MYQDIFIMKKKQRTLHFPAAQTFFVILNDVETIKMKKFKQKTNQP